MTLSALAASSALTSITSAPAAPPAANPAPTPANGAPAPAFNKLLDRARTSDDGATKDETALPKGAATDADDSDTDTETSTDNVVTLGAATTPTPSPDALTAAAGESVTAVLALIQMASAALTSPPSITPAVTTTPTTPTVAAPTITAPIVNTTPVALASAPAALQQVLAQASNGSAEKAPPAIGTDQPTTDIPDIEIDLPAATTTVVTLPKHDATSLDTATVLAALKARAAVIDGEAAPQIAAPAAQVVTAEPRIMVSPALAPTDAVATPTRTPVATTSVIADATPTIKAEVLPVDAPVTPGATPTPMTVQAQPLPVETSPTADMTLKAAQPETSDTITAPVKTPAVATDMAASARPIAIDRTSAIAASAQPVSTPVQPGAPVALAPTTAAAPRFPAPHGDGRAEPVKAETPRAEADADTAAPVADATVPSDPLPTPVAVTPERAPRVEASAQAVAAAPADNQPVARHLDLARDTQWLDQLTRDINQAAATSGQLKFQLNPERLGALTVEIANSANGASIKFTADSADAQKIIADAQPRLVAEARAQGLTIAETKVDLSNQRSGGGASTTNGQTQGQSGQQSSHDAKPFVRTPSMMREEPTESATRDDDDRYA